MFGKQKHVYTCPDSIHDHAVAKKNAKISLAVNGAFLVAIIGGGAIADYANKRRNRKPDITVVPDPAA